MSSALGLSPSTAEEKKRNYKKRKEKGTKGLMKIPFS
jgi:hypothetical protein